MTDDDVLAAVRDCLTTVRDRVAGEHMECPASDIIARVRRRRMRRGLAAAAAVAVITAVAAPALLPSNAAGPARLAAWTVASKPGGQFTVTIRQLRDPAGLQRELRAHGVPATVRFSGQAPRDCLYYPLSTRQDFQLMDKIFPESSTASDRTAFTIDPAAIPARIGLWINVSPAAHASPRITIEFTASWALVYASGHCPPEKPTQNHNGRNVGGDFTVSGRSH